MSWRNRHDLITSGLKRKATPCSGALPHTWKSPVPITLLRAFREGCLFVYLSFQLAQTSLFFQKWELNSKEQLLKLVWCPWWIFSMRKMWLWRRLGGVVGVKPVEVNHYPSVNWKYEYCRFGRPFYSRNAVERTFIVLVLHLFRSPLPLLSKNGNEKDRDASAAKYNVQWNLTRGQSWHRTAWRLR